MQRLGSATYGKRQINVIEVPSLPEFLDDCIPLRLLNPKRGEIELCPEQEIQVDSFTICRHLTDEIHRAVVERLGHRDELAHSILPLQPELVGHASPETFSEVGCLHVDEPLN